MTWESQISMTFRGFSCISLTFLKISNFPDPVHKSNVRCLPHLDWWARCWMWVPAWFHASSARRWMRRSLRRRCPRQPQTHRVVPRTTRCHCSSTWVPSRPSSSHTAASQRHWTGSLCNAANLQCFGCGKIDTMALTHFILKVVQTSCSQFLIISSNQSVAIFDFTLAWGCSLCTANTQRTSLIGWKIWVS